MRSNHWSLSQKLPQCQREDGPTAIPAPRGLVVQKLWDPDFHCEQGGALTDAKEGSRRGGEPFGDDVCHPLRER